MSLEAAIRMVEDAEGEVAELCSRLVRLPTVNPPGYTRNCVDFIQGYFKGLGVETSIYERVERKANICAHLSGRAGSKVLFLGHLDVVTEGLAEAWDRAPFSGDIADGRVYGRGSSDMKGACASAMVAARFLSGMDEREHASAEFWFTCDEESGAVDGARWLAEEGLFKGDLCIIEDSSGSSPARPLMDLGCKGAIRPTVIASGVAAHGSVPFLGENAIEKLFAAIQYLKRLEDYPLDLPGELEPIIQSSIQLFLEDEGLNEAQRAAIRRLYHYPTVSFNMVKGGARVNIVPERAEAVLDIRLTPGSSLEAVKAKLQELLKASGLKGVEIDMEKAVKPAAGYYEPPNSKAALLTAQAIETAVGAKPVMKILTGGTDGIHVKHISGIPCIGFGAGLEGMAHVTNEYVTIETLVLAAKAYVAIAALYR